MHYPSVEKLLSAHIPLLLTRKQSTKFSLYFFGIPGIYFLKGK